MKSFKKIISYIKWCIFDKPFFTKWYRKAVEKNGGVEYATIDFKQKMLRDAQELRITHFFRILIFVSLIIGIINFILKFINL